MGSMGVRVLIVSMLLVLCSPASSMGGTFDVRSCGASATRNSSAWQSMVTPGVAAVAGDWCVSGVGGDGRVALTGARWIRADDIGGPLVAGPSTAGLLEFEGPPSAKLKRIRLQRRLQSIDDAWEVRIVELPSGNTIDLCDLTGSNEPECPDQHPAGLDASLDASTTSVEVRLRCEMSNCGYAPGGLYDFAIAIYSSEVTIEENVAPSVGALTTSGAGPGGWFGSAGQIGMSGSDTLGIRRFEVLDGDQVVGTIERTCVDWSVLPCAEPSAGLSTSASASTGMAQLSLQQGVERSLRIRAIDAAGNATTSAPVNVAYDSTPRTAQSIGKGVQPGTTTRTVNWTVGGNGAPAVSAVARICTGATPDPASCEDRPVAPEGPLTLDIPASAYATARITITDAAGNTGLSELVSLPPDTTAPLAPVLLLNSQDGAIRRVAVASEDRARLDAKLCVVGGACTALPVSTSPTLMTVTLPEPGTYDLVVTATDASGNASAPSTLRLTRSAPLAEPKSIELRVRVASNLAKRRIAISGTVAPGSTSKMSLTLVGRTRRGRTITKRSTISVPASGRFTKRLRLPSAVTSQRSVRLTLTPVANDGWRQTRYTHTIRPLPSRSGSRSS